MAEPLGGHCSCHEVGVNTMPLPFHWTSKRRLCFAMGGEDGDRDEDEDEWSELGLGRR